MSNFFETSNRSGYILDYPLAPSPSDPPLTRSSARTGSTPLEPPRRSELTPFPPRPTSHRRDQSRPPQPEPSQRRLPQRYPDARGLSITYEVHESHRDRSKETQALEESIFEHFHPHLFEISSWSQLQHLLAKGGFKGKLTDEHLRWLLKNRCQVRVIKKPHPQAGKLLRRPHDKSEWWVDNATLDPTW